MKRYQLVIIGGGPSGYAAAMRAADLSIPSLLIEEKRYGGAGLRNGALSSKAMWELSRAAETARKWAALYDGQSGSLPYSAIHDAVEAAVSMREEQIGAHLSSMCALDQFACLQRLHGRARLISPHEVEIRLPDGSLEHVEAEHIVLATGSRPRQLPHIRIDEEHILTSDGVTALTDYPESMVILGAGVIGCEFATIFAQLGRTRVCLIDKSDRILPFEDEDLSAVIEDNLLERGVCIHKGSRLVRMEVVDGEVEYELAYSEGKKEVHRVKKALVAVGRVPNTEDLGLENAGIQLTERGYVPDTDTQTEVPHIYAVGDLTHDLALVNVGELEGRRAVEKIAGLEGKVLSHRNISTIMFLCPETAGVGMNETQAREAGIAYRAACVDYRCIPRAIAMGDTRGFFKLLVTDDEDMRLLGIRAVGEHASSAIQAAALLIQSREGIEALSELLHPHPSIIEGVQECARMLLGKSILKPGIMQDYMWSRRWAPSS